MKSIIYLDMDGVLADFEGCAEGLMGPDWEIEIKNDNWGAFANHPNIYDILPVMPDAVMLYEGCLAFVEPSRIQVLTALPNRANGNFPDAVKHKIDWVHRHISPDLRVHFGPFAKHKQFHKKHPHDVLIDDMPRNIDQWNAVGGIGILHTSTTRSLIELTVKVKTNDIR